MVERAVQHEFIDDAEFNSEAPYCKVPYLQPIPTIEEQQQKAVVDNFKTGGPIYLFPNEEELITKDIVTSPQSTEKHKTEEMPSQPSIEILLHEGVAQDVTTTSETSTPDIRAKFRERLKSRVIKDPRFQTEDNQPDTNIEEADPSEVIQIMKRSNREITRAQVDNNFTIINSIIERSGNLNNFYAIALKILKNPEDARDALQNGILKFCLQDIDESKNVNGLLSSSVSCEAYDIARKRKKVLPDHRKTEYVLGAAVDHSPSPGQTLIAKELEDLVSKTIDDKLQTSKEQERDRLVMNLRDDGYTQSEIAEILELPKGTIKTIQNKYIKAVREVVSKIYEDTNLSSLSHHPAR